MKENLIWFFRSVRICSVVLLCILMLAAGMCRAYESMRIIQYGEYKKALELSSDGIRILDFEIEF